MRDVSTKQAALTGHRCHNLFGCTALSCDLLEGLKLQPLRWPSSSGGAPPKLKMRFLTSLEL